MSFPKTIDEIMSMLVEMFRHQQKLELANICETAGAFLDNVEYDNWNGGTYRWQLRLELPIPEFSSIESRLDKIEEEISVTVSYLDRQYPNHTIGDVIISPVASATNTERRRLLPSDAEVEHIWPEGKFRLFLSHRDSDKAAVAGLKKELSLYGVHGFVAHEEIKPAKEWQNEIELGLRSMQALVALLTTGFHESEWTDQEIGWGMGRGVPVISARLGCIPCGFIGRYQAILECSLDSPKALAAKIVKLLLEDHRTHPSMRNTLLKHFSQSTMPVMSQRTFDAIATIENLSTDEVKGIKQAYLENPQVNNAYYMQIKIEQKFGKIEPVSIVVNDDEVPF